jgi:hypothetical protein
MRHGSWSSEAVFVICIIHKLYFEVEESEDSKSRVVELLVELSVADS